MSLITFRSDHDLIFLLENIQRISLLKRKLTYNIELLKTLHKSNLYSISCKVQRFQLNEFRENLAIDIIDLQNEIQLNNETHQNTIKKIKAMSSFASFDELKSLTTNELLIILEYNSNLIFKNYRSINDFMDTLELSFDEIKITTLNSAHSIKNALIADKMTIEIHLINKISLSNVKDISHYIGTLFPCANINVDFIYLIPMKDRYTDFIERQKIMVYRKPKKSLSP